jgi:hypothetical protein
LQVPDVSSGSTRKARGNETVTETFDDDEDLFAAMARERGLASPGEYAGELMTALPFATKRTSGVDATVKITEGDQSSRLVKLRFIEDGPASLDGIIAGNVTLLKSWWGEVEAKGSPRRAEGFLGVFKTLWRCGQGRRLIFTIDIHLSGRFSENVLTEVRAVAHHPF